MLLSPLPELPGLLHNVLQQAIRRHQSKGSLQISILWTFQDLLVIRENRTNWAFDENH